MDDGPRLDFDLKTGDPQAGPSERFFVKFHKKIQEKSELVRRPKSFGLKFAMRF
jgi:hypothetical protein